MSKPMSLWMGSGGNVGLGIALGVISARDFALANDKQATVESKRRACLINGIAAASYTMYTVAHMASGELRNDAGLANCIILALVSAMNLYQGLKPQSRQQKKD